MLRRASDVVERAGVAADLRPVAFSTAVDLILKDPAAALTEPRALPGAAERAGEERAARLADPASLHGGLHGGSPAEGPSPDAGLDDADDTDDAPSPFGARRLGPVPVSSTAAHRSAGGSRVAARVGDRFGDRAADRLGERAGGPAAGAGRSARSSDRLVSVGPGRGLVTVPDDPWGHIADALGVRPELLDRVWEERGGRIQLAGDPARFGRTRAQRVGTAAVLLLAALRWSGQDGGEPVPDAVVRAEVERLGLLDTGNYTKHLAGRRQLLSTTGSGRTATYKLRYDGLEEARTIAQALLEDA